jgi:hypothetical protein
MIEDVKVRILFLYSTFPHHLFFQQKYSFNQHEVNKSSTSYQQFQFIQQPIYQLSNSINRKYGGKWGQKLINT